MAKVLLILTILIVVMGSVIALGRSGANKPQPRPSQVPLAFDYAGWKNYENKNFGYTMHYPHDWYEITVGLNPPAPTTAKFANVSEERLNGPHAFVEVTAIKKNNRSLLGIDEVKELLDKGHEPRNLTISGYPAILLDNVGDSGLGAEIFVDRNDYFFRIKWDGNHNDARQAYRDKSLQTMASIRFVN